MQIKKLSKELEAIRKLKSDEYGPFNKKMQAIADDKTPVPDNKNRCVLYGSE